MTYCAVTSRHLYQLQLAGGVRSAGARVSETLRVHILAVWHDVYHIDTRLVHLLVQYPIATALKHSIAMWLYYGQSMSRSQRVEPECERTVTVDRAPPVPRVPLELLLRDVGRDTRRYRVLLEISISWAIDRQYSVSRERWQSLCESQRVNEPRLKISVQYSWFPQITLYYTFWHITKWLLKWK